MERRIGRLGIGLMLMFMALLGQLTWLQVINGPKLANHPGNTRNAVRDFGQLRGSMVTADGKVIASSARNPNRQSKFTYLRSYPLGRRYAHLTGYFSFTYGTVGLERQYNGVLAGRQGALVLSKDKFEQILEDRVEVSDLTLTIHDAVQQAAQAGLDGRRGSVVALDIKTGAVLAIYSNPTFDPGPLAALDQKSVTAEWKRLEALDVDPKLARAWRQVYPPGSTFKTITTAAALDSGTVTPETVFPVISELPLPLSTRPLKNFGGKACGGSLTDSFVVSCNTSFAKLGLDLGADQLFGQAQAFGFGRRPPLDTSPAPVASRFPEVDFFRRNTPALAQSAIGQSDVAATPLQMALVAAAIGNGGAVPEPHLVARVQERTGAVVKTADTGTWLQAVNAEVAAQIAEMMEQAVLRGTGTRAALDGVRVAAKTGTAQTTAGQTADGSTPELRAHAWTIGFAPVDAPRVAVAVIIESQPEVSATTGGRIAAPVLAKVMSAALTATAPAP
jgi:penicillin-binding protein A